MAAAQGYKFRESSAPPHPRTNFWICYWVLRVVVVVWSRGMRVEKGLRMLSVWKHPYVHSPQGGLHQGYVGSMLGSEV